MSADRIQEVLDTPSTIVVADRPVEALARRGSLELRNVGFGYPGADAPVLAGITLTASPGETTAIIGSTGSGKTTLLNLIPRLFDATEGEVLSTASTSRAGPRGAVGADRPGAAEALPVLGHRRLQPALR
nr:ABC transporter ATP-binding protein [Candidatus Microthrix sp.]